MTTRAGMAFSSHRAKQNLMKLLFENNTMVSTPSYSKLRSAYLEKLQELHPDKYYANENLQNPHYYKDSTTNQESINSNIQNDGKLKRKALFVELQDAWDQYSHILKQQPKFSNHNKKNNVDADFTMFGVGCSFADSPEEQKYRSEIMDQASRGWFSAGALSESHNRPDDNSLEKEKRISLCDDDLFIRCPEQVKEVVEEQGRDMEGVFPSSSRNHSTYRKNYKKKCLVDLPFKTHLTLGKK